MKAPSGQSSDPHTGQPVLTVGAVAESAAATLILLHGRGGSAQDMLSLYRVFDNQEVVAIAPQAAGNSWYPYSFLAPLEQNQPWLDSALNKVDSIVSDLLASGVRSRQIVIGGFSQGACLTAEFVARHPRRYGAVFCLTGGLIGPPSTPRQYGGSLDGTPVFLGSSDPDPHVPFERVKETQAVFAGMNGRVDLRRYPGLPHTINEDEMEACRELLKQVVTDSKQ